MKRFLAVLALLFTGVSTSAQAGIYLQMLHNNSAANVRISARVPGFWVGVPHYPIVVKPHHSLFDVAFYEKAYYKLCRHQISNVAVPPGGSCSKAGTYMLISVGKTHYYKIYDCNWKITVLKKSGSKWKFHQSIKIKSAAKIFWAAEVESDGNLKIAGEQTNMKWGDRYRGN